MLEISLRQKVGTLDLDISFYAPRGITAIFGPSGSGKTSLLRAVAGLSGGSVGTIRVGDRILQDAHTRLDPSKRGVGFVFQDARLFPHMRVSDNLTYGGCHDHDRVVEMLGLSHLLHRFPASLSGGEGQRVAIGRALMSNPAILLLDEPLASLDAPRKIEIMPYLERLRDHANIPVLFVSHDLGDVARLATTLVMIGDGKVIKSGQIEQLLSDPELVKYFGSQAAGAVVTAQVKEFGPESGLTTLVLGDQLLFVPGKIGQADQFIRLRIPSRDIILARNKPEGLSALNILSATIASVSDCDNDGVNVVLTIGQHRLLARLTRRSVSQMDLMPDQPIYAIVKATAVVSHPAS